MTITDATGPLTLSTTGASGTRTLAVTSAGALNLTGAADSLFDLGATHTLSLQTTGNGPITTGTGLLTQGGDITFNGTSLRTITGPTTGGLTITDATGPLTLSTTGASGTRTLAVTSAGALNLTGAAPSAWNIGSSNALTLTSSLLNLDTSGNLSLGKAGTPGSLVLYNSGSNTTTLKSASSASSLVYTLPNAYPAVSGYALVSDGSGNMSWALAGGSSALSAISVPTVTGANGFTTTTNSNTTWNFNGLTTGTALTLGVTSASTSTVANGATLLGLTMNGTQTISGGTSYGAVISNTSSGANSVNVGLKVSATGGTPYAIIVPNASGYVGFGTSTPTAYLNVVGANATGSGAADNTFVVTGGVGGTINSAGTPAGDGSAALITGGVGGVQNNATVGAAGGVGGAVTLTGGVGGTSNATPGAGGSVKLNGGIPGSLISTSTSNIGALFGDVLLQTSTDTVNSVSGSTGNVGVNATWAGAAYAGLEVSSNGAAASGGALFGGGGAGACTGSTATFSLAGATGWPQHGLMIFSDNSTTASWGLPYTISTTASLIRLSSVSSPPFGGSCTGSAASRITYASFMVDRGSTSLAPTLMATNGGQVGINTVAISKAALSVAVPASVTYAATFSGGNVGIGTVTPSAPLHILKTTEQLRLGYDATNAVKFTVGSGGGLVINQLTSGLAAGFNFTKTDGTTSILDVDTTNARVGIGTAAPSVAFEVKNGNMFLSNANNTAGELRFQEGSTAGTNYIAFKAPASGITSSVTFTLPSADGTSGQILQTNGSGTLSWTANSATGMANPMTTTGDIIYGSTTAATSTPARLAIGSAGQCLVVSSGLPAWGACGASTSAAGSNTQIQFNNSGVFGASSNFAYDDGASAKTLSVTGSISGVKTSLALLNSSTGSTATNEIHIGNSSAADTLSISVNSHEFTSAGDLASIYNRQNADLRLGANNAEVMRIISGGNVAIGSTTATSRLVIKGSDATSSNSGLNVTDSAGNSNFFVRNDGNIGINNSTPTSRLSINGTDATSSNSALNVADSTGSSIFFVRNDSTVGIGTTSPLAMFSVGSGSLFQVNSSGAIAAAVGITSAGGTISLNDNSSTNTVSIGGGTTTGSVTLGGTGTQTISIGNAVGIKTVNLGSSTTSSTTTILSGSGGLSLNASNNQPTNIGTGTSTGLISIGGGAATVAIDTNYWDISSLGVATGFTGVTSSGAINFTGSAITFSGITPGTACNDGTHALGYDSTGLLLCNTPVSDVRLKKEITPLDTATGLSAIERLSPVSYYWKDTTLPGTGTTQQQFGFIAQDVSTILPNLVTVNPPTYLTPDVTYGLNYQGFTAIIVQAIKELDLKIQPLSSIDPNLDGSLANLVTTYLKDATIKIKDLTLETLHIGSADKPAGITLYDTVSKQPYCLTVTNGVPVSTAGECGTVSISTTPSTSGGTSSATTTTTSTTTTSPTTTTDSSTTSTTLLDPSTVSSSTTTDTTTTPTTDTSSTTSTTSGSTATTSGSTTTDSTSSTSVTTPTTTDTTTPAVTDTTTATTP